MAVSMSVTVDGVQSAKLQQAIAAYSKALGIHAQTAPQRAAIAVCKSLRSTVTRVAPKYARSSEYAITKQNTPPRSSKGKPLPKYVTSKDGRKLRLWHVNRTVRGVEFDAYGETKSEVRKSRLRLVRAGLARQSWGWVMHNIFNGAAPDTPWQRRRNDRRDPRDAVRESTSSAFSTFTSYRGYARIVNRLDYITAALREPVEYAVDKAANWMLHEAKRIGVKHRP